MRSSLSKAAFWGFLILAGGLVAFYFGKGYKKLDIGSSKALGKEAAVSTSQESGSEGTAAGTPTPQDNSVVDAAFAPNRETLAIHILSGGLDKLCLFNLRDRKIIEVLSLEKEFFIPETHWLPNGQGIIFIKAKAAENAGGKTYYEEIGAYYLDLHTGSCNLLANRAFMCKPSPDGSAFCYMLYPTERKIEGGIIWEKWDDPKSKKRFLTNWAVSFFNWSLDGKYIIASLLFKIPSIFNIGEDEDIERFALVDVSTGKETIIDSTDRQPPRAAPAFITKDEVLYLTKETFEVKGGKPRTLPGPPGLDLTLPNIGREFNIVSYNLKTGKKRALWGKTITSNESNEGDYPVDFLPAPNGKMIAVVLKKGDEYYVQVLDIGGEKVKVLKEFSTGKQRFLMNWHPKGKALAVVKEGHLYLLPINGKEERLL